MKRCLFLLASVLAFSAVQAAEQRFASGPERTGVLELYTSEGCSSCPPAERWFSELLERPGLWSDFIPLAFHVDYWDYIGWKDPFAEQAYSARQRDYARAGSVRTVYTPGFIYNGDEWRNWFGGNTRRFPDGGKAGELNLTVDGAAARVQYQPVEPGGYTAHVALLGFGISIAVKAGENAGRKLDHDFVVLEHVSRRLKKDDGGLTAALKRPASDVEAARYAIVAWVSVGADQSPVQATGGWLAASERVAQVETR